MASQNKKSLIVISAGVPCPATLTLVNPNVATGTVNLQATNAGIANNTITGTAKVDLRAGKLIELKSSASGGEPTFEVAAGTVF